MDARLRINLQIDISVGPFQATLFPYSTSHSIVVVSESTKRWRVIESAINGYS